MSDTSQADDLQSVLEESKSAVEGDKVSVGEIMDSVSKRGFGPLLLIPALISVSPIGAIPGMSIVTGSLIALIAIHMLLGKEHPWIPKRLEEFEFSKDKYEGGIEKMMPWAKWASRWVAERWTVMLDKPVYYATPVVMLLLSLTYYPLALVPMGVFLPGLANTMFAIGLTVRDGAMIVFGHICTVGTFVAVFAFWPF
ncbi:MAG: exopolysaccharide biosynthesis protein [Aureliella sp.]